MTLSEYMRLNQDIKFNVESAERHKHKHLLKTLKDIFKKDINSPRRFEQITTIEQLLQVLEVRDVLSEDNVEAFRLIAQWLPNNTELLGKIAEYEVGHVPRENVNYYAAEHTEREPLTETQVNVNSNPYSTNISRKKLDRIWLTITEEIGSFWRDFGRNLKIRECVIEGIHRQDKPLMVKAKLLIEYYETRADPQKWFFSVCDALEKCRRKDLSKKIQDIMTMDI